MAPSTLLVYSPSSHHLSPPPCSPSEAHHAILSSLSHSSSASSSASGDTLTVPSLDSLDLPSRQTEGETEVGVKLFLPRPSGQSRAGAEVVEPALGALRELVGGGSVDQVVVGWADVVYEGEETDFSGNAKVKREEEKEDKGGCGGLKLKSRMESELGRAEQAEQHGLTDARLDQLVDFWQSFSASPLLPPSTSLGITSFSLPLLQAFLAQPLIRPPKIDHLNLKDCCHIPQVLSNFAREKGVRLVSSNDVSEPINPEGLKELLAPYQSEEGGLPKGEVELDWVLKYTILHKTRGVLIDKGYILSASFRP